MTKLSIELPSTLLCSIKIPVRITDINYGNHVGNDSFVSIIHEARVQWLQQNNCTELNFCGSGLIMANLAIDFKKELFYGDDLQVNIYSGETSRVAFELFYELIATRNRTEFVAAKAMSSMICYNYETKRPVSLNDDMMKVLSISL